MRSRFTTKLLVAVLAAISCATQLAAQTTTSGGLTGVVTDPSGAVVPGVDVALKDEAKGTTRKTTTDQAGAYRFFFLAPGRFTLTVKQSGFREELRAVSIPPGPPVSVNLTLTIAKASATVTVTQDAPLIHAENGDASSTVSHVQVAEVPNPGNDLTYIAQTAPGVVMNTDNPYGGNFSMLGMPATSYLYTLDGMHINDNGPNMPLVGALGLLLGQNQIQEATVVSNGYSGQFGGAAGGVVNFTTKSGGNQVHGNAQYYWNGPVLNANDWINKAMGNSRPFDIANQWAGSIGGPLRKNKLFYFFDTEGLRIVLPQFATVDLPSPQFEAATMANIDMRFGPTSASDSFYRRIFSIYNAASGAKSATPGNFLDPLGCTGFSDPRTGLGISVPCAEHFFTARERPSQDTLASGRIDWNISNNDHVFARLLYEYGRAAFISDPIDPVFDADVKAPWWQGQVVETHTFGSSAANQLLVAGTYNSNTNKLKDPSLALSTFPTILNFGPLGTFNGLGPAWWIAPTGWGRKFGQFQVTDDLTKTWHSQKFGFGVDFTRIYSNYLPNDGNIIGVLSAQTVDAFFQGGVDPASPSTDFTLLTQAFSSQGNTRLSFHNFGLYGQDEWHTAPNLTITVALRIEHYSNPTCPRGCFARLAAPFESLNHDPAQPYNEAILTNQQKAVEHTDSLLWSPRFSFAWQPFGVAHNSVLRGGIGIFYDPLPGIQGLFASNAPIYNSYSAFGDNLTPGEQTSLFKDVAASNAAFLNGFASGQTLAQIQAAIPNFSPPGITAAERTMHSPQYQRWSLQFEQAFGANTSLSVGYFGNHGIHEVAQNPSANGFGFGSLPPGLCSSPPVPPCADPRFGEVTVYTTNAVSNFNGLVVSFKHQFSRWSGGMFQANYTYSHAFDEVSNGGLMTFSQGGSLYPQDPYNLRGSYGNAEYDVRHSLNASYVWELPLKAALRGHGPDALFKGWQISGTIFARTGLPYTILDAGESSYLQQNNYFGMIYSVPSGAPNPGLPCGKGAAIPLAPNPCLPSQVLPNGDPNPNALFVQTGCETGFNAGNLPGPSGPCSGPPVSLAQRRNQYRGPSYFNTDFAIMKNTRVPGWESATLGIGFQFFNFFNHPNFGFPDNWSSSPTFGRIFYLEQPPTTILGNGLGGDASPRMIQLRVQLQF